MTKAIYLLIAIFPLTLLSCKKNNDPKIATEEVLFTKEGELTIFRTQDTIMPIRYLDIEIADNNYERQTGLMYRKSMQDLQAMLFVFQKAGEKSFYMKNTLIPLDIIYIDADYKIVSVQKNAKPLDQTSLPSKTNAQYVLEINGGLFDQWQLRVRDSIAYRKM